MIPYGRQDITEEDIAAVAEALREDFLTGGPRVGAFEEAFATYVGAKYAVAVSSGTAALHLSALALNVKPGDKVIVPSLTFAASANCIRYCGGEVVFGEINPRSGLLDLGAVREILEKNPKDSFAGIVVVDYAGWPADLEKFRALAEEFGLWIIEDASHSPGGYFADSQGDMQLCGNGRFADLATFSFHPVKHLTTGEGGMITTNDAQLYKKLLRLRTHGIHKDPELLSQYPGDWYYELHELGFNYRLTAFQAALGLSQLKRATPRLARRKELATIYDKAFEGTAIKTLPPTSDKVGHAYHLYVIQVSDRKGLFDFLRKSGIFVQLHYVPVHLLPYYKELGWKEGDLKLSENFSEKCLSIPLYPELSEADQQYVIGEILRY